VLQPAVVSTGENSSAALLPFNPLALEHISSGVGISAAASLSPVRPESLKAVTAGPNVAAEAVAQVGLIFALYIQRRKQSHNAVSIG
jgi:hypothetical protein